MTENLKQMVDVSQTLSNDITTYIIFISLVFMVCFLFLGFQLLNIFKSLLYKILEDISEQLADIKGEIKELKDRIGGNK